MVPCGNMCHCNHVIRTKTWTILGRYSLSWNSPWISWFGAWVGMLSVDHYHINPVLLTFVTSWWQATERRSWSRTSHTGTYTNEQVIFLLWCYTGAGQQEMMTLRPPWEVWDGPGKPSLSSCFPAIVLESPSPHELRRMSSQAGWLRSSRPCVPQEMFYTLHIGKAALRT